MEFKKYVKTTVAEMAEWHPIGTDHEKEIYHLISLGVSISKADLENGSPKEGDLIARNSENYDDKWLVSKDYARENFVLK